MFSAQLGVGGSADRGVLRGDGTAAKQVARSALARVIRDSLPKQSEDDEVAVLAMHARAPQFDHFRSERFKNLKFKLLRAIVAQARGGVAAGLQTVGANRLARRQVF